MNNLISKRFKCFSFGVVLLALIFVVNYGILIPSSHSLPRSEEDVEGQTGSTSDREHQINSSIIRLRTRRLPTKLSTSQQLTSTSTNTPTTTTAATSTKATLTTGTTGPPCIPAAWNTSIVENRTAPFVWNNSNGSNSTNRPRSPIPSVQCSSVVRRYCLRPKSVQQLAPEMDGHITRIIHQSWKRPELPPRFIGYALSWCECFPDWKYVLWTDEDNELLVREHYAWFYAKYKSFRQNIYRIDAIRYIYMHRFGGVYTDLDNVCLRNFEHVLAGRGILWGDMESPGRTNDHFRYVQNSFMYSRPGHPFWLELLRRINQLNPSENSRPEYATGPYKLMGVLADKWNDYIDMAVYPPEGCTTRDCLVYYSEPECTPMKCSVLNIQTRTHVCRFNPFSWWVRRNSPCKDLNNMNDEEMRQCIEYFRARPKSFVLQLHTQTWLHGKTL